MTRKLAVEQDAIGFNENSQAARQGGRAAGKARLAAEEETGVKVISADNFLKQIEEAKQKSLDKGKLEE
jgi:DNA-damage-inducible protein D